MTTTPAPQPTSAPTIAPTPTTFAAPRTLSILSLVAAIAAVPLGHLVILPVAAIVLGFLARGREPQARTMSTWGIAIGFVVLFGWVVAGLLAVAFWLPLTLLHIAH